MQVSPVSPAIRVDAEYLAYFRSAEALMPPAAEGDQHVFSPDEVVLTLHDEGPYGRLVRMKAW